MLWTLAILLIFTIPLIYACVPTTSPDTMPDIPGVFTTTTGSSLTSTSAGSSLTSTTGGSSSTASSAPTTTTTIVTPACLAGWVYFPTTNFCYIYEAQMSTWTQARQYCTANGVDLVSIHSQTENDFITSLTPPSSPGLRIIIGPRRIGPGMTDDNFSNFDGTAFDYSNWGVGRPDNGGANMNQNCVFLATGDLPGMVFRGEWNDLTCFSAVDGFICKAPKL